ncbi:uncharacterized protein METZ01_LOCUS342259, partial [marine metagenome]
MARECYGVDFNNVAEIIERAISKKIFPCACLEIGRTEDILWRGAFGHLSYERKSTAADHNTIFDLASLTKVIATAPLAMQHVDARRWALSDYVTQHLRSWCGADRELVTIEDLLAHTSGLQAYLPLFQERVDPQQYKETLCRLPLQYAPRSESVYSDLGFILLGFMIEDLTNMTLDDQFQNMAESSGLNEIQFLPPNSWKKRTAPTGDNQMRGRCLIGEVHDDNGWALGGVAGHTGLFGSTSAVGRFARIILGDFRGGQTLVSPATLQTFTRKTNIPNSSRALGWDTMLPTS